MSLHLPFGRHTTTAFIVLEPRLCKACWACLEACPQRVINKVQLFSHKHAHIGAKERCKGCLKCVHVCQNAAIHPKEKKDA